MLEIEGQRYFGINSTNLSSLELGREWSVRLGLENAFDRQTVFHAEAHALMRTHRRRYGSMPSELTMYVDRISCSSCQSNLPDLTEAMGIRNLTLVFSDGRTARVSDGAFIGDWQ